jgi:DNA-binding IclR family transcriptional regulator
VYPYGNFLMAITKVKSASRVIQILDLLAFNKYGMHHKDLAEDLKIPKGSLTKLLANLVESRYLSFDPSSKSYKLGARVLGLANSYVSGLDVVQAAQPIVRNLVAKTDESASLVVLDGISALVVHRQYGNQPMSFRLGIGARIPLYATASGKALLAFMPKAEIDAYLSSVELKPLTHATITDSVILLRELDSIRAKGVAYCRQERFEGLSAIAVPVFGLHGRVSASLTVMYLNVRTPTINLSTLESALRKAADELSVCLGFQKDEFKRVYIGQDVNSNSPIS